MAPLQARERIVRREIDTAAAPIVVRPSHASDVAPITAIYRHHVLHGLASFEEVPPDADELARRRADVLARGLPHLVACDGGAVLGYAYAGPYRTRSAYRYTVEDSVYIAPEAIRRGVGRALLAAVIDACALAGCRQMIAVIGDSGHAASIGLHRALGFEPAGMLRAVGFKFGRWVDSVLMQRALGPGDGTSPP
jgi:phosphinothricin acetyltransferase